MKFSYGLSGCRNLLVLSFFIVLLLCILKRVELNRVSQEAENKLASYIYFPDIGSTDSDFAQQEKVREILEDKAGIEVMLRENKLVLEVQSSGRSALSLINLVNSVTVDPFVPYENIHNIFSKSLPSTAKAGLTRLIFSWLLCIFYLIIIYCTLMLFLTDVRKAFKVERS